MFIERKALYRLLDLNRSDVLISAPQKKQESSVEVRANSRVLPVAATFLAKYRVRLLAISGLLLIPCFWHRHIEAGDLGSHIYNAWLAQLIEQGHAPGLRIAHPSTNILFDYLLSGLAKIFGLQIAEKISVALAVLIFFWGAFALIAAATKRAPWLLTPLIAMVAYGWTFEMGFFNYYIALGLSFFALAIFWPGTSRDSAREWAIAIVLIPLIYVAHPLGVIWLVAAAAYIRVASFIPPRFQIFLVAVAAGVVLLLRLYLSRNFVVDRAFDPLYLFNAGDQLVLFSDRYKIVEALCGIFVAVAIAADVFARRRERGFWQAYLIPLELYVIAEIAVFLLPDGVRVPNQPAALALITERLTSDFSRARLLRAGRNAAAQMAPDRPRRNRARFFCVPLPGHCDDQPHGSRGGGSGENFAARSARARHDSQAGRIARPGATHRGPRMHRPLLQLRKLRTGFGRVSN